MYLRSAGGLGGFESRRWVVSQSGMAAAEACRASAEVPSSCVNRIWFLAATQNALFDYFRPEHEQVAS